MEANNIKSKSKKYKDAQAEFFTGAMAAFIAILENATLSERFGNDTETEVKELHGIAMTPKWIFSIMRGEEISKQ